MSTNYVGNNTAITLGLVLICVLTSAGLILFEGMSTGILFFTGYLVIATISSTFRNKRHSSRRAALG